MKACEELDQNEIRDYINRAPKRLRFDGGRMVNTTHVRLKWLAQIAIGTLNERINRRAGQADQWTPWKNPVGSAIRRHGRRQAVIKWGRLAP